VRQYKLTKFPGYKAHGLQPNEELLPEDANTAAQPSFVPNSDAMQQLEGMGFPLNRAEKALHATGNSDANQAMEWLFAHMEDADIDSPLVVPGSAAPNLASPEKIATLVDMMGFSVPQARQALKETGGDVERAVDWIFSHPDAQGDFEDESAPATAATGTKELPGSASHARFELNSIICHKGSSVHSG